MQAPRPQGQPASVVDTLFQGFGPAQARVRADANKLSTRAPMLALQEDTHISNDGQSDLLLSFTGAIPIRFKGNQYNIPIQILLPKRYPKDPPLCYVRPTSNMELRQRHKHVDSSGQCFLPYLHKWNEASSDLVGLLLELQSVFGADPPVYAKSSTAPTTPPTTASPTHPTVDKTTSPTNTTIPPPGSPYNVVGMGTTSPLGMSTPSYTMPKTTQPPMPTTPTTPPQPPSEKAQLTNKVMQRVQGLQIATNLELQKMDEQVAKPLREGQAWLAQATAGLRSDKDKLEEALIMLRQKDADISS